MSSLHRVVNNLPDAFPAGPDGLLWEAGEVRKVELGGWVDQLIAAGRLDDLGETEPDPDPVDNGELPQVFEPVPPENFEAEPESDGA